MNQLDKDVAFWEERLRVWEEREVDEYYTQEIKDSQVRWVRNALDERKARRAEHIGRKK